MSQSSICFVAGRSGGHIIPAITLARKFKEKNKKGWILFFATNGPIDKKILEDEPCIDTVLYHDLGNVPRLYKLPHYLYSLIKTAIKSFIILRSRKPKEIVTTGGYIAIPVCIAGKFLGIPITVWELNAEPGKAVQILKQFARTIIICFHETAQFFPAKKCTKKPYPVRFGPEDKVISPNTAKKQIGIPEEKKVIFVVGGSQGSRKINEYMESIIQYQHKDKLHIIHQTAPSDLHTVKTWYKNQSIAATVFSFTQDISSFYIAADLIVCRAGAGTLFEVAFFEKPCITIPLETKSTDHQCANAYAMQKNYTQPFFVLRQKELAHNTSVLLNAITTCLE